MPSTSTNQRSDKPSGQPSERLLSSPRHLFVIMAISAAAIVIVGLVVLAIGVYSAHWRSPTVKTVSRLVPLPTATVNGQWLSYYNFLDAIDTLNISLSKPEVLRASGFSTKPTLGQLQTLVLERMVKDAIVEQLAAKRGVVVTPAALDAEIKKLTSQTGSPADVEQQIRALYGWDLNTFSQRVVKPFLIRQRLQESISADDKINADQIKAAESAWQRVKAGKEDFKVLAAELNQDSTKNTEGDLGIFGRGERVQALEDAVFALEVGQTSGIVRTVEGFHILKLLEKIPADPASDQGERVHAAHIFILAKQLDQWLFEQTKQQRVTILLSGYQWDSANARVIASKAPLPESSTP
ncbi:MAG: peptidylprolyl isomerase [Candidatus Kerfeldbacteria bacterium]|nr:peptidylprolyl isomerase [Candidatus Kerfeldbacteria bacterium]